MATNSRARGTRAKRAKTKPPCANSNTSLVVKPKPKPTSQIVVTQAQSLELAITAITATISTYARHRNLFPKPQGGQDCFTLRFYDWANPEVSYEAFINGEKGFADNVFSFAPTVEVHNWWVLKRNVDPRVDKLLDWIEIAAKDALEQKYLAKLQFLLFLNDGHKASSSNIFEAYTVTFSYAGSNISVGVAIEDQGEPNPIVLCSAKKDLYNLVEEVDTRAKVYRKLPHAIRMTMKLIYNSTCPSDYQPFGFHAAGELVAGYGPRVGSINTGHHEVSVDLFQEDFQNIQHDRIQPEFSRQTRMVEEKANTLSSGKHVHIRATSTTASPVNRPSSISSDLSGASTQELGLQHLKKMWASRDLETQDTRIHNETPSQQRKLLARDVGSLVSQNDAPNFLPYSQSIVIQIDRAREQEIYHTASNRYNCECGVLMEEEYIRCDLCTHLKHIPCYGNLGTVSPNVKFACYSCLFMSDSRKLEEMAEICLVRRALYYVRQKREYMYSLDGLANHLDIPLSKLEHMIRRLENEGYIKRATRQRSLRHGGEQPLFSYIADDEKLCQFFFRPDLKIMHLLTIPENSLANSIAVDGSGTAFFNQGLTSASSKYAKNGEFVQEYGIDSAKRRLFAAESSTQGTPSSQSTTQFNSENSGVFSSRGRKRPATNPFGTPNRCVEQDVGSNGATESGQKRTKVKASDANSPWLLRKDGA